MRGGEPALGGSYGGGLRSSAEDVAHILCATGSGTPALPFRPGLPGNAGQSDLRAKTSGAAKPLSDHPWYFFAAGHRVPREKKHHNPPAPVGQI